MNELLANNITETPQTELALIASDLQQEGRQRIVVIGSGPVGMHFVNELMKQQPHADIHLFGNEPYKPYNRVQLSALLAGDVERDAIDIPLPETTKTTGFHFHICAIDSIDIRQRMVMDALGQRHSFDKLVLAIGARAFVPTIPGIDQKGVYTFRNLKDTEFLSARTTRSRNTVVVGGGLLGLEAAKALSRAGTQVTLVQQGSHLMNRQLDETAADMLRQDVEAMGIKVITNTGVREILGANQVTGVRTRDEQVLLCDTVLVCAGIQPNIELARDAELKVIRGIVVNDKLQTSHPDVYAIGECCEHDGQTYGLVAPGFEQAAVAANVIAKGNASYQGSITVSRLKVVGKQVCSMGEVVELPNRPRQHELQYHNAATDEYRKLVIYKNRLIGAVGLNQWPEINRIQEAYKSQRYIFPWQRLWFRFTGKLWINDGAGSVKQWPENAIVCQCNGVTQGTLVDHIDDGITTLPELQSCSKAGTVCGSCKPLLSQLLDTRLEQEKSWLALLTCSLLAVLITGAVMMMPEAETANSVMQQGWFEKIWNDKFYKQVTGFSLLGLTVIGMLMSLRKRISWFKWMGNFSGWRVLHNLLGVACAATLILHTGFHLGENLNRYLMLNFLAVVLLGALTSVTLSFSHKLSAGRATQLRKSWTWLHLLISWPLPVLLIMHIITVYYF